MIILEIVVFSYFALYATHNFVLSLGAKLQKKKMFPSSDTINKIAVLIPGYKEDDVIVSVAQDALNNNYPKESFDVIVIADSFKESTLEKLSSLPIKVIEVQFDKSTKTKALNTAFATLEDNYEVAVILDADNIMEKGFLRKINDAYNVGHCAIQAQRTAKNDTNSMAILDGISEAINNHIYRKGNNTFGISSTLIGSGMAFNYRLLKETLLKVKAIGGFDRELQVLLSQNGNKILYLEDALLYDEKVESAEVFKNQRRRWISSQFVYLRKFFFPGIKSLFLLDFNTFNMTIMPNLFLPRLLNIALIPVFILIYIVLDSFLTLNYYYYIFIYLLIIVSIILAIPPKFFNKKLVRAIFRLPHTMFIMAKLMFSLRGANKRFIHTPHKVINVIDSKKES